MNMFRRLVVVVIALVTFVSSAVGAELGYSPWQFAERFNILAASNSVPFRAILAPKIQSGKVNDAYVDGSDAIALMGTLAKGTTKLKSLMLTVQGDGSDDANAIVLLAGVAFFEAGHPGMNQKLAVSAVQRMVRKFGSTRQPAVETLGSKRLTFSIVPKMGAVYSIEPSED